MLCLREVKKEDLSFLLSLKQFGVTSLPRTEEELLRKIHLSEQSFASAPTHPGDEYYFFILEENGTPIGTSSIHASATTIPTFRKIEDSPPSLQLVTERPDASELCGLVLQKSARARGLGHLLSYGRFLYIADHLVRFHDLIIADIRGFITPEGSCPFWDLACRPFSKCSFQEAEEFYGKTPQEIQTLLPNIPIPLSREIQPLIGKTHPSSAGALRLLVEEGFRIGDEIHPIDGGPRVLANLLDIRAIREGEVGVVSSELLKEDGSLALLSRTTSPFRATQAHVKELSDGHLAISSEGIQALQVSPGDHIRYLKVKR